LEGKLKKHLLTTTALAAAGMLAATGAYAQAKKPTLSLGGWGEGIVVIANEDDSTTQKVGVDVQHEAEIHFKGSATLDNGIKIATRVELEGNVSSGDQIDESYVTVTGSFGQIRLGADDNAPAAVLDGYGSGATGVANHIVKDSNDVATRPSGHEANFNVREISYTGDAEKITYFTPRISGFRAGFSWEPSSEEDANNSLSPRTGRHDGWSAAVEYTGKFSGVGLSVAAGYVSIAGGTTDTEDNRPEAWNVGATVDVGAFTVSALYGRLLNVGADNAKTLDIGARYKAGKNHFSVNYLTSESEASTANTATDDTDILLLSYRRDLGPGVQYRLNLWWVDYTGETVGSSDDGETFALSTSIRVAF
jgi:outer membrane protein OmpU